MLGPWPNQFPEVWLTDRWRFGVSRGLWCGMGPSRVYQDQYPLTDRTGYSLRVGETTRVPNAHRQVLGRVPAEVRDQIRRGCTAVVRMQNARR